MFDLSITKILVLAVIALVIFGPDQLPKIARQAGQALRDLRRIAESAKADLQEGLGPEFRDFDITDLHPKNFVRKHLLGRLRRERQAATAEPATGPPSPVTEAAPIPGSRATCPPLDAGPEPSPTTREATLRRTVRPGTARAGARPAPGTGRPGLRRS